MTRVIELRLHQPVVVEVLEGKFNDASDLCFIYKVFFIVERASTLIGLIDLEGKVTVKPRSLKYCAGLLSHLARFSLPLDGTVPVFRKRLNTHLQTLVAEFKNSTLASFREAKFELCCKSKHSVACRRCPELVPEPN